MRLPARFKIWREAVLSDVSMAARRMRLHRHKRRRRAKSRLHRAQSGQMRGSRLGLVVDDGSGVRWRL